MAETEKITGDGIGFMDSLITATALHQTPPSWLKFSEGVLDEAKILYGGKWEDASESVVTIIGPTAKTMDCLRAAMGNRKANDKNEILAQVRIMTECIYSLPANLIAKRPFVFEKTVIIEKGECLVPPDDFEIPEGMEGKRRAIIEAYVREVLPVKLWSMVLSATWILATPDFLEMMERRQREIDEQNKKGEKSDESPNSPEESSGSSEET